MQLKEQLPKLHAYTRESNEKALKHYLRNIEGFARDGSAAPNDPIGQREMTKVFGAMLNIEATFIRFDYNQNNLVSTEDVAEVITSPRHSSIMGHRPSNGHSRFSTNPLSPNYLDPKAGRNDRVVVKEIGELDKAFDVYRDAIIAVADLDNWMGRALSESIFLYMLKYQSIPSSRQAITYYLKPFKEVKAKRSNIGALLYFMVNQGDEKANKINELKQETQRKARKMTEENLKLKAL